MDSAAVASAYRLYEHGLSLRQIADKLWARYGFPNSMACRNSLGRAFRKDGLTLRSAVDAARAANSTAGGRSRHPDPAVRAAYQREYRHMRRLRAAEKHTLRVPLDVTMTSAAQAARLRDLLVRSGWSIDPDTPSGRARILPGKKRLSELILAVGQFAIENGEEVELHFRGRAYRTIGLSRLRPECRATG
jgi:hypothetical protein